MSVALIMEGVNRTVVISMEASLVNVVQVLLSIATVSHAQVSYVGHMCRQMVNCHMHYNY